MTSLGCVNGDVAVVAVAAVEPQQQQRLDWGRCRYDAGRWRWFFGAKSCFDDDNRRIRFFCGSAYYDESHYFSAFLANFVGRETERGFFRRLDSASSDDDYVDCWAKCGNGRRWSPHHRRRTTHRHRCCWCCGAKIAAAVVVVVVVGVAFFWRLRRITAAFYYSSSFGPRNPNYFAGNRSNLSGYYEYFCVFDPFCRRRQGGHHPSPPRSPPHRTFSAAKSPRPRFCPLWRPSSPFPSTLPSYWKLSMNCEIEDRRLKSNR